ncbi:iron-sulfur cluster assembly accessory protein [Rhodopseudomonas rhenobacensis]|uniref:Iron-sulfur cluster assembly accessory protein n=1 Tax=Rhodopseudomonas rhenobacensis TaxID=87461 RepID=A0A7W7Z5C2_9BRAD|nr:iron-sulfur cluster assembly accessory protein [Rhodopseudomonas rhenobacensis]MBB5048030.1 iron-sulfur cluster assembly accessory protein [Rhodopseudomonas rhenobacensis]
MSFTLTPSAEKFIRRMLRFSPGAGGFRLNVSAGGCAGLTAEFDVEPAVRPGEVVETVGDLSFFLPVASQQLLDGVVVDFVETPTSSGFMFHDPKRSACGCATDTTPKPTVTLHQLREI